MQHYGRGGLGGQCHLEVAIDHQARHRFLDEWSGYQFLFHTPRHLRNPRQFFENLSDWCERFAEALCMSRMEPEQAREVLHNAIPPVVEGMLRQHGEEEIRSHQIRGWTADRFIYDEHAFGGPDRMLDDATNALNYAMQARMQHTIEETMLDAMRVSAARDEPEVHAQPTFETLRHRALGSLQDTPLNLDRLRGIVDQIQQQHAMPTFSNEAHERAKTVLREHLNDEQRANFDSTGTFVTGHYRISSARSYSVTDLRTQIKYCLTTPDVPVYDQMLAIKLLLENDPDTFFRTANHGLPAHITGAWGIHHPLTDRDDPGHPMHLERVRFIESPDLPRAQASINQMIRHAELNGPPRPVAPPVRLGPRNRNPMSIMNQRNYNWS